jgi:predicted Rossmann-fold nucleotide-binding protein
MTHDVVDTLISPEGRLEVLSKAEVAKLLDTSQGGLYQLFRKCALAVLNSGSDIDDGKELLERYKDFEIKIIQRERGIKLDIRSAPAHAFVDGKMIKGIHEHLFSVLRDIVYVNFEVTDNPRFDLERPESITDAVFHILRNANVIQPQRNPNLVVCWGGHSINRVEYNYTKHVGYQLGLRELDICTGCGPGAMKDLVIMPDIEKRLEAFVRTGHGIIVFPGGAGTAEEILYILGILLHPDNADMPFPLVFTGPAAAKEYFEQIDQFIGLTLGEQAQRRYKIIVDDPAAVAQEMQAGIRQVREFRKARSDAYYFNWGLKIDPEFQKPFRPTHENMRNLSLHKNQETHLLAANLRRAFSGVVAGNVKEEGIREIEKHGKFEIHGDEEIMAPMDKLLQSFVEQSRMKLPGKEYIPCYRVVR